MEISKLTYLLAALPLAFAVTGGLQAQLPPPDATLEVHTASVDAPVKNEIIDLDVRPALTEEQKARIEEMLDRSPPGGSVLQGNPAPEANAPAAGTESKPAAYEPEEFQPQTEAAGDFTVFRRRGLRAVIPKSEVSNVAEVSGDMAGRMGFLTGNWFAARSDDGGNNWTYINPYSDMADFCCDQRALYDPARDIFLWMRMGIPDGNGENRFRLSVDAKEPFSGVYWSYDVTPTAVNAEWTGEWWDYTEMQMTADHLFITWNLFNAAGAYTRTVILRWPLDELAAGAGFTYSFYDTTAWATYVPIAGADHTMWLASNWPNSVPQNSRLNLLRWHDDSSTISSWINTVPAWTFTYRGLAQCGAASGNWAERGDQRLQTGARYRLEGTDLKEQGRNVIAWWWNVAQGGNFTLPYIEAAAFYEDTLTQPATSDARPYVFSSLNCFGYPSVAPNARGDLGMVFHTGNETNSWNPDIGLTIADDYIATPPGWIFYVVANSDCRPSDNKWGDYNTTRSLRPGERNWIAGAHRCAILTSGAQASFVEFFVYGRERDKQNWVRWRNR